MQEWQVRLQPYQDAAFDATVLVEAGRNQAGQPSVLRWLLRNVRNSRPVEFGALEPNNSVTKDYPLQLFCKGEMIPLDPQAIWQVRSGLVKLTAFSDRGDEVIVGLAANMSPFGPSLTALPLYQATALADTHLV